MSRIFLSFKCILDSENLADGQGEEETRFEAIKGKKIIRLATIDNFQVLEFLLFARFGQYPFREKKQEL